MSRTVKVLRGESVVVPLSIFGASGEPLQYVIRSNPKYGKLGPITSKVGGGTTVTYKAPVKIGIVEDRFTYAVQGREGVSAPGVVTVAITDPPEMPEKLVIPRELEFPSVFLGQRSAVELELANEGGGFSEGQVTVQPPWSIEGPKEYRIGAKSKFVVKIVFTPDKAGEQAGEAIVGGAPRRAIALRGSAEERLTVTPARLDLRAGRGNQTRMAVLRLANRSGEPAKVAVTVDARLLTDASVTVPARGEIAIPVFADAGTVGAFDDQVSLKSDEWSATVPVRASALGPMLRFSKDDADLGHVAAGQAAEAVVTVENSGGESASVQFAIAAPFTVTPVSSVIAPGKHADLLVRMPSADPGTHTAALKAQTAGSEAKLTVRAEVAAEPVRNTRPPAIASPTPEKAPPENPAPPDPSVNPPPAPTPFTMKEHPNALGAFARATSPKTAVLDWPASLGPTSSIRIEEQNLALSGDGKLRINWVPLGKAQVRQEGSLMHADLPGLRPGASHTIRVVAGQGNPPSPIFTVQFWTPPAKPVFAFSWKKAVLLLIVAVLGFAAFRRWKRGNS